ncbi:MAG TPA: FtsX-like permease family protein [Streptosporangiaceae bacterium]
MIGIGLKQVWAYKRRLIGTFFAVSLGVAFLAGTLMLGDTLRANFDRLFSQANSSTEVLVRGATKVGAVGGRDIRAGVDSALVSRVSNVAGVAKAEPYIEGQGQLLGRDGKGIGGNGPPTWAANWVPVAGLNPYRLVAGHVPEADNQVVINRGAAKTGNLRLGDTTTLLTPRPVRVVVVGIATFGNADGFGPSTFTGMTLHAAQRYLTDNPGQVSSILVQPSSGVSASQLLSRLRPVLPGGVQAITGSQLAQENFSAINSGFLGFVRTALTAFAVIALLVAAFSIYNTFSIVAAQRTRSAALLRAVGASRRQIFASGLVETVMVGLVGSLVGLAGGIGIAGALKGVFDGFGFALPAGGLDFKASTALIAIAAGLSATVIAGTWPALRASKVSPLAALREVAAEPTAVSRWRIIVGAALVLGGVTGTVAAALAGKAGLVGLGAVGVVTGVVAFGPVASRPVAAVLGAPLARLRGVTGTLARQNAMRNPRRTAASATALMVGVAVVAVFTVIGASLKASAARGVDESLRADLVVSTGGYGGGPGGGGLSPELATSIARLPSVAVASGLGRGQAMLDGVDQQVTVANPAALDQVLSLGITAGALSPAAGTVAVSESAASDYHWRVGSVVPITYPDGTSGRLRVSAIYSQTQIAGDYVITQASWAAHARQVVDRQILVKLRPGASLTAAQQAVAGLAAPSGKPRVQDRDGYRSSLTQGVNTILGLIYVMLVLAIVIALMGITNTLSLAIHERTRELGLLRAIGQTQAQTRSVVRWESVLIALFGTVVGVVLGTFLGWAVVRASGSASLAVFSAPAPQLLAFLAVGAAAGVLAGLRPARRAARLEMMQALATE